MQALGWEFLDADGEILHDPMCGEALMRIGECRPPSSMPIVDVRILYDVDNPLLGVQGSARVFAPQKGATPEQVRALEAGLAHWAALLQRSTGRDGSTLPGGGAAGGLPAGLVAAMDARLEPGIDAVCDAVKFERQVRDCDLVLTGEGRLDEQTASGKVVAGVARVAKRYGKRVVALVGAAEPLEKIRMIADRLGLDEIIVITPPNIAKRDALAQTREHLVSVVASYIRDRY